MTMSSSAAAPFVPIVVDFGGLACDVVGVTFGVKAPEGFKIVRATVPLGLGNGPESPNVLNFEPGEYHVINASCRVSRTTYHLVRQGGLSFTEGFKEPQYRSYASFRVPPAQMLNIGRLRIHVNGGVFERVEVLDLQPQTLAALKRDRPEQYAQMQKSLMVPTHGAAGASVAVVVSEPEPPRTMTVTVPAGKYRR